MTEQTTPVTIRIPNNLINLIDEKAIALGSRKRTVVILELLKQALEVPTAPTWHENEKLEALEARINALETNWNLFLAETTRLGKEALGFPEDYSSQLTIEDAFAQIGVSNYEEKLLETKELVALLKEKNSGLSGYTLDHLRVSKKKSEWQEDSGIKFKYKEAKRKEGRQNKTHYWSVIETD